jgi:hypothetical protein
MFVRTLKTLSLLVLTLLALGALEDAPVSAFRSREPRGVLFAPSPQPAVQVRPADPTVVRSRLVTIDISAIQAACPTDPSAIAPPFLLINLFDDVAYNAVVDRIDPAVGGFTWVGHIPGIALSTVTLATVDGVVSGGIVMPEAAYVIRYVGSGVHEVAQIDQSTFLPEADPIIVAPGRGVAAAPLDPALAGDDGSTIDVLVLYTPAAAAEVGGTSGINALINQGISDANTSYGNSGVTQRLRLVSSQEVSYTEDPYNSADPDNTGTRKDLSNLQGGVGALSGVAGLRNANGADIVSLVTRQATDYCGIGYMMDPVGSYFEPYAFSVVSRNCIPGFTLAHEMGHNMGARHDWYMDSATTPYTYAHGYVDTQSKFRTVMSYNNVCSAQGFNCTRLLYWSNPAVVSPGANGSAPMGIPGGTKSDCPKSDTSNISCDADDHQTLNNTAITAANFRQASSPAAPSITRQPSSQTVTAGSTATLTAAASGYPPPTVQWQVSTNGGSTWSDIGGATSTEYSFTATGADSGKRFRAVFTNSMGAATTTAATLTVTRLTPTVTWANPTSIVAFTALGSAQLNATATVAGFFVYTPPPGTVLTAGAGQTLAVTFTPTDTVNYSAATKTVTINVTKVTSVITWTTPAAIVYGTALGATQLRATANVPGTFVYSPATGTVLNAGIGQTLSVTFTPTDAVNYTTATQTVTIDVALITATDAGSDFNGDGKPDILWRSATTGENYVSFMDGVTRTGGASLDTVANVNWKIVGAGDFTGDGKPDILWRNETTGENYLWFMDGATRTGGAWLDTVADLNWKIVGTEDFTGDGKPDILWRNATTGKNYVWSMDGTTRTGGVWLDTVADLNWEIADTGDFTGDGKPDILWRNATTGENYLWPMGGATRMGGMWLDTVADLNWKIVGAGDFNGDGKPDLLWRNASTGENYFWYMNGATRTGGAYLVMQAGLNRSMAMVADFNGDGKPDLL